jgi:hypothetical protein
MLRDFDRYTIEQTRHSIELYGGGKFPDLLEDFVEQHRRQKREAPLHFTVVSFAVL